MSIKSKQYLVTKVLQITSGKTNYKKSSGKFIKEKILPKERKSP